eukprot:g15755.t2
MRTRNESIAQKSGLSKNAEDLLKVVQVDQPAHAASESQVMDKLHAFFVALEYLNICEFSYKAGPLQYLADLEEWRHENRGLALLLSADTLIRKKVYRLNSDHKQTYQTFSDALLEVLKNHKQLWNDARSSAELDKFKQAGHSSSLPTTPPRGYQLKRGAQKPLLEIELEPGQAIRWALEVVHPFSVPAEVDPGLAAAIDRLAADLPATVATRLEALRFWESEAHRLLPVSLARIAAQPDPDLRRLLRGGPDDEPALLGQVCHVALYEAMLQAVGSCDISLVEELLNGFAIVGTIGRSCRWPPYDKPQKVLPVEHALARAWAIRKKIITRVAAVPVSENLVKIWEATLEDCREGSCRGPWMSEHEISVFLGCQDWIPTQRFEVVQKNKVRGCDSATTNLINQVTEISEKLQLPSTDSNVAALRKLRSEFPSKKLGGWVLDERKAYRQVAIRPDQRKFSVICLKNPETDQPAFFVMVGHSFGLVSAVYNYNRRSAAINEILVKLFNLIAFSFYDDKYGFEPVDSVESARLAAECVHTWLGARYDQKKLQLSTTPTVLGVTYNLDEMQLEIKPDRRLDLLSEIQAILDADLLDPGTAGKLKGKLMFGASQLWGKIGRAFLRVISERQYMRIPLKSSFGLDPALREALVQWKDLVDAGPPRTIDQQVSKKADVIIFTDGFTPDPRDKSQSRLPDRVGAVMFDRRLLRPKQFSEVIPKSVSEKWLQRTTQIIPIEMMAPVLALSSFADRLVNSDVILLIDSEAVEAALIKGYSSKSDVCLIISVFWKLALKLRPRAICSFLQEAPTQQDVMWAADRVLRPTLSLAVHSVNGKGQSEALNLELPWASAFPWLRGALPKFLLGCVAPDIGIFSFLVQYFPIQVMPPEDISPARRGMKPSLGRLPSRAESFADLDNLSWLNVLFSWLWPNLNRALVQFVNHENVTFSRFTLGSKSPELGPVQVTRGKERVDIVLDMKYFSDVGSRESALFCISFQPIMPQFPIVGGAQVFFPRVPELDMEFTGLAALGHFPGIEQTIRDSVKEALRGHLVLPRIKAIVLSPEVDPLQAMVRRPLGVLHVRVSCEPETLQE